MRLLEAIMDANHRALAKHPEWLAFRPQTV
jgi:hypothetical protein